MECAEVGLRGGRGLRGPAEPDPADLEKRHPVLCRKPVLISAEWLSLLLGNCLQALKHTALFQRPAAHIASAAPPPVRSTCVKMAPQLTSSAEKP